MNKTKLFAYGAVLALSFGATAANAVDCPAGPATSTLRVFTASTTPDAICWDYDAGNDKEMYKDAVYIPLPGPGTGSDGVFQLPIGSVYLGDNTGGGSAAVTVTGMGTTGGDLGGGVLASFSINLPSAAQYIIALKSGSGSGIDPDWAAFLLPAGVTSGTWAISGSQALSHMSVYSVVPIPAAAWLLGSGLLGLFAVGRRRKTTEVAAA